MTRKEAIEIVRNIYETKQEKEALEFLIPELAESEDERVRKEIIRIVDIWTNSSPVINGIPRETLLAYLEKQKEQNVAPSRGTILGIWELGNFWKENPEEREGLTQLQYIQKYWFEKNDYLKEQKHKFKVGDRVTNGECVYTINKIGKDCYWVKEHDCATIPFEYEDTWNIEQKPTSTVKSKFKSGDSIRFNGFGSNEYTIQLVGNGYYVNSEGGRMDMSYTDANFVLVENAQKEHKPIFKKGDRVIWDGEEFNILNVDKDFYNVGGYIVPFSREGELHPIGQKPADNVSREEYVKRFKALCDAYEIKLPNREYDIYGLCDDLAKLSMDSSKQKPTNSEKPKEWSEEDEKILDKVCCLISPGTILNASDADYCLELKQWIVSLQERILKLSRTQPKQEWSKEDEERLKSVIHRIEVQFAGNLYGEGKLDVDWLKSLRPSWKPSEEQMYALAKAVTLYGGGLDSLYQDLKKLM